MNRCCTPHSALVQRGRANHASLAHMFRRLKMGKIGKAATVAGLVAASTAGMIQPAAAHADPGVAVAAGILGLGVGAAIASDHPHYHRPYYYAPPPPVYYAPPPAVYYAPPPPPPYYYGYRRCGWRGCW
jgi:hypothetical protein